MRYRWKIFDGTYSKKLPKERKYVLVQMGPTEPLQGESAGSYGLPPRVAVGYLRYSAGDKNCPFFVVPGVAHTVVTHWCDCLGYNFAAPWWAGSQYGKVMITSADEVEWASP